MGHFYCRIKTFINHVYFHNKFIIPCFPNFSCIEYPFDTKILEDVQREFQILQDYYGHKRHSIGALGYCNMLNMQLFIRSINTYCPTNVHKL